MKRSYFLVTLFTIPLMFFSVTYAAPGMTADELRAEIARLTRVAENIRAQLLKFGDDPSTVVPGVYLSGVTSNENNTGITACLKTNRQMRRGHKGESVRVLQQFLAQQGVYSADLITGYFGPATERGVQAWQARSGIVSSGTPTTTGYGRVGPITLRAMQAGCPGGVYTGPSGSLVDTGASSAVAAPAPKRVPVERYSLSLSATRGIAPMSVTAKFTIEGSTCTSYVLDWGDGSNPVSYNSNKSTDCTSLPINITRTHIYNTPGTYMVRFKNGKAPITKIEQVSELTVEVLGVPQTSYQ